jgi:hypothetical protein
VAATIHWRAQDADIIYAEQHCDNPDYETWSHDGDLPLDDEVFTNSQTYLAELFVLTLVLILVKGPGKSKKKYS